MPGLRIRRQPSPEQSANRVREAIVKAEQPRKAKRPRRTKKPRKEVAA